MTEIILHPSSFHGALPAVPSKSDAHRQLICAALCDRSTQIMMGKTNEDIEATIRCLNALGARIALSPDGVCAVQPFQIAEQPLHCPVLDCGESGSTLRFLLPLAGVLPFDVVFQGSGRLPLRPLSPLKEELCAHGVMFSAQSLPFTVSGVLQPGRFMLPGNVSSQFFSGLLFALPLLSGDSEIEICSALESAAYLKMTITTLSQFGIDIDEKENRLSIAGKQRFQSPSIVQTEGDWSSAAFQLSACMGGSVVVNGLNRDSHQPDRAILDILSQFGASVEWIAQDTVKVEKRDLLGGFSIDAGNAPDLVPIVSILACAAHGRTVIRNAARLRLKESDRLQAMVDCITALGGKAFCDWDTLTIDGTGTLQGGKVNGYGDHRVVMAAAVSSVICANPVTITDAEAINKSYPDFFAHLSLLQRGKES